MGSLGETAIKLLLWDAFFGASMPHALLSLKALALNPDMPSLSFLPSELHPLRGVHEVQLC